MAYTTINKGSSYFNGATYLGSASAVTVSSLSFKPDFVWIKDRQNGNDHCLVDSVRGVGKYFSSNLTAQEVNSTAQSISSFTSTGFVTGTANPANEAASNTLGFMSWNWLASNTTTANTSGTISSTISVNQTAGFSVVSYTGNSSAGATIGHGLGVKPSMIITKQRSGDIAEPVVYHTSLGATKFIKLNNTDAAGTNSTLWNDTEPTSTLFTVGTSAVTNASHPMIAYCFAAIKGYSSFGSYTGNGSADGTFIYTGFKPAFILFRRTSTGDNWVIKDSIRDPFNVSEKRIYPNQAAVEDTSVNGAVDILSNGFKNRSSNDLLNQSGDTYIYMAFASNPFVTSTLIPTTAR